MKALIIADESHKEMFKQITNLKKLIEEGSTFTVDILEITDNSIYLNGKRISKESEYLLDFRAINQILERERYELCYITLTSSTFKTLLSSNGKFFDIDLFYRNDNMVVFSVFI